LYNAALDETTLHEIASNLGGCAAFPGGGCVLMEGDRERITPLPTVAGWLFSGAAKPVLSTPHVYAQWDALALPSSNATPRFSMPCKAADLSRCRSENWQASYMATFWQ
jgi:4-diphosphocytidyl-2C-methyl-D-erythritol kinase